MQKNYHWLDVGGDECLQTLMFLKLRHLWVLHSKSGVTSHLMWWILLSLFITLGSNVYDIMIKKKKKKNSFKCLGTIEFYSFICACVKVGGHLVWGTWWSCNAWSCNVWRDPWRRWISFPSSIQAEWFRCICGFLRQKCTTSFITFSYCPAVDTRTAGFLYKHVIPLKFSFPWLPIYNLFLERRVSCCITSWPRKGIEG